MWHKFHCFVCIHHQMAKLLIYDISLQSACGESSLYHIYDCEQHILFMHHLESLGKGIEICNQMKIAMKGHLYIA